MEVTPASEGVILQGMYSETNPNHPVIRFYVTVGGITETAIPDEALSFNVTLSYDGLELGRTYTVFVVAENAIGNGTVQTPAMFTVPGNQHTCQFTH